MSNSSTGTKRTSNRPLSIRFTDAEKAGLSEKAGGVPLGTFIRSVVLGEDVKGRDRRRQYAVRDGDKLGRLLGLLGQSRLANNLNQIAKAANMGSLPVTVELEADLRAACGEIAEMRQLLLAALGIRASGEPKPTLSHVFSEHAGDSA